MPEIDHIVVVFESPDGKNLWKPVERELIPDWLREPAIFDRMLAGEQVTKTDEKNPRFYQIREIDRPRPAGQHKLRIAHERAARGEAPGGIVLPN